MATDAQTLISEVACYGCLPNGQLQLLKLGLLKQILLANDPMADTSPEALMLAAKCYGCLPQGFWPLLELGLLQQISDAGGAVAGNVSCSTADPVAAPSGSCALHYRTDNGSLWKWNGAAWEALLGP